jgi:Lar family restriction alleviation protein
MTNLNEQLLPCPFCGGQAQDDFIEDVSYIIECSVCETTTGCQDNAAEAIAAWNRRAPAAAPAPVAAIKTWQQRMEAHYAKQTSVHMLPAARFMEAEIADLRAALAAAPPAPAAAPIVQTTSLTDLRDHFGHVLHTSEPITLSPESASALFDAMTQGPAPIVQPVAWMYECRQPVRDQDIWCEFFSRDKPEPASYLRNVQPLYAAPTSSTADAKDAARLDWLNENFFSDQKDDWDERQAPNCIKWKFFGPMSVQGDVRRVIDAAITSSAGEVKP